MIRRIGPRHIAACVVALVVVTNSCAADSDTSTIWCTGFAEIAYAGLEMEAAEPGSANQIAAANRLEQAAEGLSEIPVPSAIEEDFVIIRSGMNPEDGGDAYGAALSRIGDWAKASCDFPADLEELLEAEA